MPGQSSRQRRSSTKRQRTGKSGPMGQAASKAAAVVRPRAVDDHPDVLHAIERTVSACAAEDGRLDHNVCASVLNQLIRHDPPCTLPQAWLYAELLSARDGCVNLTEEVWMDCLCVTIDVLQGRTTLWRTDRESSPRAVA